MGLGLCRYSRAAQAALSTAQKDFRCEPVLGSNALYNNNATGIFHHAVAVFFRCVFVTRNLTARKFP